MSYKCFFIERPPLRSFEMEGKELFYVETSQLQIGAMWWWHNDEGKVAPPETLRKAHLTKWYWDNWSKTRAPIFVMLPGRNVFCIDSQGYDAKRGYFDCWQVKGRAPLITVTPSINMIGRYHGHLTKGVLTLDLDGRKY